MPKRKPPIPVYVSSLEIENVRCFGKGQHLDLTCEGGRPARWTLILGENGVGKTTLLQCLAWMRLVLVPEAKSDTSPQKEEDESGELRPLSRGKLGPALAGEENETLERLLRVGPGTELTLSAKLAFGVRLSSAGDNLRGTAIQSKILRTTVQLSFDTKRVLAQFKGRGPRIEKSLGGEFHDPLVVAYGANRRLGVQNLTTGDLDDPIASRLSGLTELYDVEEILSGLDYASKEKGTTSREHAHLEKLREVLTNILPENLQPSDIRIFPPDVLDRGEPSGVHVRTFSGLIPLVALSLGYQTTLAWTADLAWRLLKRFPGSPNPLAEPAVVLIDEIDLHLHPLWQLRILDDLSEIFPGTQFIATSHSPLMVQVAETANFVLLRKRETEVEIVNDPEVIRSWRVDQILTSQLFGVPRSRNKQTERLLTREAELLDKHRRSAAEAVELEQIRLRISKLPTAQDPDDQKAIDYIREAAALLKKHKVLG